MRRNILLITAALLAAFALRLFFVLKFPRIDGDTLVYADIAKTWLAHGVFGRTTQSGPDPTYIRLPAYPAFLAAIGAMFGVQHYMPVFIVQILVDLGTCLVVADLARRTYSERAAKIALWLTALCPFVAVYTAAPLTETLAIFFAALTLDFAVAGLDDLASGRMRYWIGCGLALAASITLRPDGGILLGAIGLYLIYRLIVPRTDSGTEEPTDGFGLRENTVLAGILIAAIGLSPLIPWTIRNWHTFHRFEPLAPRYANGPDESPNLGFQRWMKTWIVDFSSVVDVYWCLPGEPVDIDLLPSRAFDSPAQKAETRDILTQYNDTLEWPPELDNRIGRIADERVAHSKLRYYVTLPLMRIADMWFRPRNDLIGINDRWWEYQSDPRGTFWNVLMGVINLFYVGAAVWAVVRSRHLRWAGLLITFVVVRSAFLGSLENPETRYTLECYPVVLVFAAAALATRKTKILRVN